MTDESLNVLQQQSRRRALARRGGRERRRGQDEGGAFWEDDDYRSVAKGEETEEIGPPELDPNLGGGMRLYYDPDKNMVTGEDTGHPLYYDEAVQQLSMEPEGNIPAFYPESEAKIRADYLKERKLARERKEIPITTADILVGGAIVDEEKEEISEVEVQTQERRERFLTRKARRAPAAEALFSEQPLFATARTSLLPDPAQLRAEPTEPAEPLTVIVTNPEGELQVITSRERPTWSGIFTRPLSNINSRLRASSPLVDLIGKKVSVASRNIELFFTVLLSPVSRVPSSYAVMFDKEAIKEDIENYGLWYAYTNMGERAKTFRSESLLAKKEEIKAEREGLRTARDEALEEWKLFKGTEEERIEAMSPSEHRRLALFGYDPQIAAADEALGELAQIQFEAAIQTIDQIIETGEGDPETAVRLMEKAWWLTTQRTDVGSYTFRGSWVLAPDGEEREAKAIRALAEAILQKGAWLEPWEIEDITALFVDPGAELGYEMVFDLTNLLPAAFFDEILIKPIKAIFGFVKKGGLAALGKASPKAATWVSDFFFNRSLRSAAYAMKHHALEILQQVAHRSKGLDDFVRNIGRIASLPEGQIVDLTKIGVGQRQSRLILGIDESFAALGKGGDNWIKTINGVSGEILEEATTRLGEQFPDLADNVIQKMALQEASNLKLVVPRVTDRMFKTHLNGLRKAGLIRGERHWGHLVQSAWVKLVLSARPGFTVINFLDSSFRALLYGANPFGSVGNTVKNLEGVLPGGLIDNFMSSDLLEIGLAEKLLQGEGFKFGLPQVFIEAALPKVYAETLPKGWWKGGSVKKTIGNLIKGARIQPAKGMMAVNAAFEFSWRVKLFSKHYFKNIASIEKKILPLLDNILVKGGDDPVLREIASAIWVQSGNEPGAIANYVDNLIAGKAAGKGTSLLLPDDLIQRALTEMSPDDAYLFLNNMMEGTQKLVDEGKLYILGEEGKLTKEADEWLQTVSDDIEAYVDNQLETYSNMVGADGGPGPNFDTSQFDDFDEKIKSFGEKVEEVKKPRVPRPAPIQPGALEALPYSVSDEFIATLDEDVQLMVEEFGVTAAAREQGEAVQAYKEVLMKETTRLADNVRAGVSSPFESAYLTQVNAEIGGLNAQLQSFFAELYPGPTFRTGAFRAKRWEWYFDMQGEIYQSISTHLDEVIKMTPEQKIAAYEAREIPSALQILEEAGFKFTFDGNGVLKEIQYKNMRKLRNPYGVLEFQKSFGRFGEAALRAPLEIRPFTSEPSIIQYLDAMFGVPEEGFDILARTGEMFNPSGRAGELYTEYKDLHTLAADVNVAQTTLDELAELEARFLQEDSLNYHLAKWAFNGGEAEKLALMDHLAKNPVMAQQLQDYTSWWLYHQHGPTMKISRYLKPEVAELRSWDSMTTAVDELFGELQQANKIRLDYEIPTDNFFVNWETSPILNVNEKEFILNEKGYEGSKLLGGWYPDGTALSAEELARYGAEVVEETVSWTDDMQVAWDAIVGENKGTGSLKFMYKGKADDYDTLVAHLKEKIADAHQVGKTHEVAIRQARLAYVEQEWGKLIGTFPPGAPLLPSWDTLSEGVQTYLRAGEHTLTRADLLYELIDEYEGWLTAEMRLGATQLSGTQKEILEEWGKEAMRLRQEMLDVAAYGSGEKGKDYALRMSRLQDQILKADEAGNIVLSQRLQAQLIELEDEWEIAFKGSKYYGEAYEGALPLTNRVMLDYQKYSPFDEKMRAIYPFWKFPTRSLPMWLETMASYPILPAFYFKYLDMSRRYAIQAGATTTSGDPLPSLVGYIPLTGTDIWWNPVAPFSFRYALPNPRRMYDEDTSQLTMTQQVVSFLYQRGSMFGLNVPPWTSFALYELELLDETRFPRWTIIPQINLIPPWVHRGISEGLSKILSPGIGAAYQSKIAPEVSWKDFLIERQYLVAAVEQMDQLPEEEQMAFALLVAGGLDWRKRENNEKTTEMWEVAREHIEREDWHRSVAGYFTSVYGKSFTSADAELLEIRDQINILKWTVVDSAGLDLNNDAIRTMFGMYQDVEEQREYLQETQYDTPRGWINNLYGAIRFIDIPPVDDVTGRSLSVEERRERRQDALSLNVTTNIVSDTFYTSLDNLHTELETRLAGVPVGNKVGRSAVWDWFFEKRNEIEANPDYELARRTWTVGTRPTVLLEQHFIDLWWQQISSTRPQWNEDEQTYDEWQLSILEWEENLPALAQSLKPLYLRGIGMMYHDQFTDEKHPGLLAPRITEETTAEGYREWQRNRDTPIDALNEAWKILYWDEFWKAVEDLSGSERQLAEYNFYEQYPTPPSLGTLWDWIETEYGDKFTYREIEVVYDETSVFDVEDRLEDLENPFYNIEQKIWDVLNNAGPGGRDALIDEFVRLGGDEDDISVWYTVSGGLAWRDPEEFRAFYDLLVEASQNVGLKEPTQAELMARVEAEALNVRFREQVKEQFGDDIYEVMAYYYGRLNSKEREEWREENPEAYEQIQGYHEFKDEYAKIFPEWAQYYHPSALEGGTKRSYGYGGRGRRRGGGGGRGGRRNWNDPFIPMGYRNLKAEELLKPGGLGRGGAAGPPHWPDGLASKAGPVLTKQIKKVEEGEAPLSSEGIKTIQLLKKQYSEFNPFLTRIEERSEEIAQTEQNVVL